MQSAGPEPGATMPAESAGGTATRPRAHPTMSQPPSHQPNRPCQVVVVCRDAARVAAIRAEARSLALACQVACAPSIESIHKADAIVLGNVSGPSEAAEEVARIRAEARFERAALAVCACGEDPQWAQLDGAVDMVIPPPARPRDVARHLRLLARLQQSEALAQDMARRHIAEVAQRTDSLRRHLAMERLLSSISTDFVSLAHEEVDSAIHRALEEVGAFARVDRIRLVLATGAESFTIAHEWCAQGAAASRLHTRILPRDELTETCGQLVSGRPLRATRIDELPDAVCYELERWVDRNACSLLLQPLTYSGDLMGFMAASSIERPRVWDEDDATLFGMVSGILANAIQHQRETRALSESEASFKAMHDAVGRALGIFTVDRSLHVIDANISLTETFGDVVGRFCHECFAGVDIPCEDCPAVRAWQDGDIHMSESLFSVADGPPQHYEELATPVFDDSGRLSRVLLVCKNISQRRQAEDEKTGLERQLRHSQKMQAIGTLAGGIAHDFNNILAAIVGYTDLASERLPDADPTLRLCIDQIILAASRARDLVQQILTFGRQSEQERQPVELQPVVKEALKLMRASLPATIEIRQRTLADGIVILADPTQMHQVLMNLCTNAYHAMRQSGGVLEVGLEPVSVDSYRAAASHVLGEGDYVCLRVADSGVGMAAEVMERIFEPFYTTKGVDEGSGMGLSVVDGIVASHGGAIEVESEQGEGTVFSVYFPVHHHAAIGAAPRTDALPRGEGERILLVDDEKTIADVGARMLRHLGYEPVVATDPAQALAMVRSEPQAFDLVITDQTMPHLTGAELISELKSVRPDLPVILMTGHSELVSRDQALALGAAEFVEKPFSLQNLGGLLRGCLQPSADKV